MLHLEPTVPAHYGYVILVTVLWTLNQQYMGHLVTKARKQYDVPYPNMYAPHHHPHATAFNCYQRAHLSTSEWIPMALTLIGFGGLILPLTASFGGALWLVGRIHYSMGYISGDPKKRLRGEYNMIGLLIMLIVCIVLAAHLLLLSDLADYARSLSGPKAPLLASN